MEGWFKIDILNRNVQMSEKRKNKLGSMTISFTLNNEYGAVVQSRIFKILQTILLFSLSLSPAAPPLCFAKLFNSKAVMNNHLNQ